MDLSSVAAVAGNASFVFRVAAAFGVVAPRRHAVPIIDHFAARALCHRRFP